MNWKKISTAIENLGSVRNRFFLRVATITRDRRYAHPGGQARPPARAESNARLRKPG